MRAPLSTGQRRGWAGLLRSLGRPALAALAALALAVMSGCSSLLPGSGPPGGRSGAPVNASALAPSAASPLPRGDGSAGAAAAAAAMPAIALDIELANGAPQTLGSLLRQHLDLARLVDLSRGERFSEAELERLIGAAPAQAAGLLATEGYFNPKIDVQRLGGDDTRPAGTGSAPFRLRMEVDPGPRARVAVVDLEVEGPLQLAAAAGDPSARQTVAGLRTRWPLPAGTEFRNDAWNEAKTEVLVSLRASGYANARWLQTRAEVDATRASVRLFLRADAGPLFRTGEIQIDGLRLHNAQTVRNLAGFGPGTPATESLLLDFQDRLVKSGLFERATVTLDGADATAAADPTRAASIVIRVEVAESTRQALTLGAGVSANTGPRVSAEHVDRRAFGRPATLRNQAEWARSRQAWDGEISTHPGPSMTRWLAGGTVERLQAQGDDVLSQRVRVGRAQDSSRMDRLSFVQIDRSERRTAIDRSSSVATTANQHWTWRQLDNPVLPTDGTTVTLQGGLGQAWDHTGTRGTFGRAWSRIQWFRPVGRTWYAQARLEAGQVIAPNALEVPDVLLFRAGGDDSVRGYAYRSLGPVVGSAVGSGKSLATASVEIARPISKELPQFWGAAFIDAGRAANAFSELKPAVGVGVGVRWRSPVGPLRLDIARGRETGENRLHFSLGIAF